MTLDSSSLLSLKHSNFDVDTFLKILYVEKAKETYKNLAEGIIRDIISSGTINSTKEVILQRCYETVENYKKDPSFFEHIKNVVITYKARNYVIISNQQIKFDKNEFSRFYSNFSSSKDFNDYAWNFVHCKNIGKEFLKIQNEKDLGSIKIKDLERIYYSEKSGYLHLYIPSKIKFSVA